MCLANKQDEVVLERHPSSFVDCIVECLYNEISGIMKDCMFPGQIYIFYVYYEKPLQQGLIQQICLYNKGI